MVIWWWWEIQFVQKVGWKNVIYERVQGGDKKGWLDIYIGHMLQHKKIDKNWNSGFTEVYRCIIGLQLA